MNHAQFMGRRGCSLGFATDEGAERYGKEVDDALRKQRTRFAVAPRLQLKLPSNRVLQAGAAVSQADFEGDEHTPAWKLIQIALQDGYVLEADGVDDSP